MPYVERDESGVVVGLYRQEQGDVKESLDDDDDEVKAYREKVGDWDTIRP